MIITIKSIEDVESAKSMIFRQVSRSIEAFTQISGDPLAAMVAIKFEQIGLHPLEERPLNLIEQVNQTFTYLTAIEAARLLLSWHPDCEGLRLAPGAHAPKGSLDIESIRPGFIGAETFAAVSLSGNRKFHKDMDKLRLREEPHRYSFFTVPKYRNTERHHDLEKYGVEVWSIALDAAIAKMDH